LFIMNRIICFHGYSFNIVPVTADCPPQGARLKDASLITHEAPAS
jgi:hypothetical protein